MPLTKQQVRQIRASLKNKSQKACAGYFAEVDLFDALTAQNVPFIRSPEQAPVDGAFPTNGAPVVKGVHPGHVWRHVRSSVSDGDPNLDYINFDVKYYSLLVGGRKQESYAYINPPWKNRSDEAHVYLLLFDRVPDYVAIVPKVIFDHSTDLAHDLQALTNDIPGWCALFMVHFTHLAAAVASLCRAARGGPAYTNPSTSVRLAGWRPPATARPSIWPVKNPRMVNSLNKTLELWDQLETLDVRVSMNGFQPLFCDFLTGLSDVDPEVFELGDDLLHLLSQIEEDFRIEHKTVELWSTVKFQAGKRSPFALGRQWHFLICQQRDSVVCLARHEVGEGWEDLNEAATIFRKLHKYPLTRAGLLQMLAHMIREGSKALETVANIMMNPPADGYDIEVIASSSSERVGAIDEAEEERLLAQATKANFHAKGLPWVSPILNQQSFEGRALYSMPLDLGHAFGDIVVADVDWHSENQKRHEEGESAFHVFSPDMAERDCIVLRCADLSAGMKGRYSYPLHMREAYWTKPPAHPLRYFFLGSTLQRNIIEQHALPSFYLFMPTGFSNLHAHGGREMTSLESEPSDARAELFWRKPYQKDEALPEPAFGKNATEVKVFDRDSAFMSDPEVNPLRYIQNLNDGEIYRNLVKLMQADGYVGMDNPQSATPGKPFDMRAYRIKVKDVLQAMWNFSLARRPHDDKSAGPGNADQDGDVE